MQKIGQSKRQIGSGTFGLNKLREIVNIPSSKVESFFKPELEKVMTKLKEIDDKIRAELTGQKIGGADAPEDARSAKDILKAARSNFNQRQYIKGNQELGAFDKKVYHIIKYLDDLDVSVDLIHNKFLFDGVDDDKIKALRQHMERKSSVASEYFIKEAGIWDWAVNIFTPTGRALAAWEKKYPKETKELREWGFKLLDSADELLVKTISELKIMATARAVRRPDDYKGGADRIKTMFNKFHSSEKGFQSYYNTKILPLFERYEKEKAALTPKPATPGAGGAPAETISTTTTAPPAPVPPPVPGSETNPPGASQPMAPPAPDTQPQLPPDEEGEEFGKSGHRKFFESLQSMGNEDPRILAGFIAKYASSIQSTDLETAVKLFGVVKKIRG